eukprot:g1023.t1
MALPCFGSRETNQFLLIGPQNAGKTTLLYKLKMGDNWKKLEIIREMKTVKEREDVGFHYEEFRSSRLSYGIWDLPGKKAVRGLWSIFYRFLQIDAVLLCLDKKLLLDQTAEALETVEEMKKLIAFMVHEPELRTSAFAILLNEKDDDHAAGGGNGGDSADDRGGPDHSAEDGGHGQSNHKHDFVLTDADCREILGLGDLQLVDGDRIHIFTLNTAEVAEGKGVWPKVVEFCRRQIVAAAKIDG